MAALPGLQAPGNYAFKGVVSRVSQVPMQAFTLINTHTENSSYIHTLNESLSNLGPNRNAQLSWFLLEFWAHVQEWQQVGKLGAEKGLKGDNRAEGVEERR